MTHEGGHSDSQTGVGPVMAHGGGHSDGPEGGPGSGRPPCLTSAHEGL